MSKSRRDFLKAGATVAVATMAVPRLLISMPRNPARWAEPARSRG